MSELPQGWTVSPLGSLIEFKYGKSLPDKIRSGHGFPVFGSNGIVGHHNTALSETETIVIGRKGSIGVVQYSSTPCSPIDTTYFVDQYHGMPARFWVYLLRNLNLSGLNKATAIPGLNREDAYKIAIPLPPLNEQKRIADKLDSLLKRVDACRERLDRVPVILKRFRQAVLAAACSGRLTADWREEQALTLPLSASHQGRGDAKGDVAFQTPSALVGEGRGEGEELPEGWKTVILSQVAQSRLGKMLDKSKNKGTPVPYLRNVNVRWFDFDLSDIFTIKISEKEASDLSICKDDVLICEGGEPGRCAVWKGEKGIFVYQKALHRVRVNKDLKSEWLCYCVKSAADSGQLTDLFTGTTIKHLTGVALAQFAFPLPPLPEQHEIVRRVEELFAFADQVEARYNTARNQVEKLTPALLAKAFRGELVPQDPSDEPADKLLERIRAQKGEAPVGKRTVSAPSFPPSEQPSVGAASGREPSTIRGRRPLLQKNHTKPATIDKPAPSPGNIPLTLLTTMRSGHDYSRAELIAATGISDTDWSWAIRQLREAGQVSQTGDRRGARYRRKG